MEKKIQSKCIFLFGKKVAFSLFTNVKCHDISRRFFHNGTHFFRDHPLKMSACLRGGGGPHGPMFADARGGGVLGLSTSAIFEIVRRQILIPK